MIFILLPAFNEEKTLPRLLEKIISFGKNHGKKVTTLVCNDSSSDKTLEAIKSFENKMDLAVINHFDWLGLTLKQLKPLARRHYFGCLGTTIAGTWVYSQLDNELDFFADEDPGRQGKSHLNLPILSPNQIPSGSKLFLAFPYQLAENIASKFKGFNIDVILPPKNI